MVDAWNSLHNILDSFIWWVNCICIYTIVMKEIFSGECIYWTQHFADEILSRQRPTSNSEMEMLYGTGEFSSLFMKRNPCDLARIVTLTSWCIRSVMHRGCVCSSVGVFSGLLGACEGTSFHASLKIMPQTRLLRSFATLISIASHR